MRPRISRKTLARFIHNYIPPGPFFFSSPHIYWDDSLGVYDKNCGILGKMSKISPMSRYYHAMVDSRTKMLVFSSPKAGSTTIKEFAVNKLKLAQKPPNFQGKAHRVDLPTILGGANNFYTKETKTIDWHTFRKEYEIYFPIRNPYDRLVSFFTNKFVANITPDILSKKVFKAPLVLPVLAEVQKYNRKKPIRLEDLTLQDLIVALHKSYCSEKDRVWEHHLGLQVTPDVHFMSAPDIQFINSRQIDDLLKFWYLKSFGTLTKFSFESLNRSTSIKPNKPLEKAYERPLEELILKKDRMTSASFYHPELEEMVKDIYAIDYIYWNQVKNYQHSFPLK